MSDRIEGVPEGYRIGKVDEIKYEDRAELCPTYITFELVPIESEQPKQSPLPKEWEGWNISPDMRRRGYAGERINYRPEDHIQVAEESIRTIESEQPKHLEAVIVVSVRELGYDMEVSIRSMLLKGITPRLAGEMQSNAPGFVTIREKETK